MENKPSWYKNVEGMISFNGAIWGSIYAESMMYDENAATKDLKQLLVKAKKLKSEFAIKSSFTNRGLMISIAKDAAVGLIEGIKLLSEESPPISLPSPRNAWNSAIDRKINWISVTAFSNTIST